MYDYIINPKTNIKIHVFSAEGRKVINEYIKQITNRACSLKYQSTQKKGKWRL